MLEAKSQQKRTDFRDLIEEMNLIYQSKLAQCSTFTSPPPPPPLPPFLPRKCHKTTGFLTFPWGIEMEH